MIKLQSIQTCDPSNQLSVHPINHINIVPDVQTKLLQENQASLFDFIPKNTVFWIKDVEAALLFIDESLKEKGECSESFSSLRMMLKKVLKILRL